MRSSLLLALAGIRRRKTSAALTAGSLAAAILMLATTLGVIRGAGRPFDSLFGRLTASHLLLFFDHTSTDAARLAGWLERRPEVRRVGLPNPVYTPSGPLILREGKLDIALQLTERTDDNRVQDQLLVLEGSSHPHPGLGEIWLPRHLAATYHIRPGDTLNIPVPSGLHPLRVSALVADPHYISGIVNPNRAWLAPGALSFFLPAGSLRGAMLGVRLHDPAAVDDLRAELEKTGLFNGNQLTYWQFRSFFLSFYQLLAAVLAVFGLLALALALFMMASAISSAIHADFRTIGIARAVGLTPGNVIGGYILQYLLLALAALLPGLAASRLLIPWLLRSLIESVGVANAGLSYGPPFAAAAGITLLVVLAGAFRWAAAAGRVPAVEAIRWGEPAPKHPAGAFLRRRISLLTLPLTVFLAFRFLLTNRRRTASALVSLLLAVGVIVFAINISHSFGRLKDNRTQWGLDDSDLEVTLKKDIYLPLTADAFQRQLAGQESVAGVVASRFLALVIPPQAGAGGLEVYGRAYDTDPGAAGLTNLEGAHPSGPAEIALCVLTARHFGKKAGDSLRVILEGQPRQLRIAGIYQDVSNLGQGFRLTGAAVRQVNPLFEADVFGLRLRPGVAADSLRARLQTAFGEQITIEASVADRKAVAGVVNGMRLALLALSLLFVFIIALSLFNDMVLSIREQRRSLAILKTLGFTPGQLRRALVWKSVLIVAASLLAGLPLALWLSPRLISLATAGIGLVRFPYLTQGFLTALVVPGLLLFGVGVAVLASRRVSRVTPRAMK